MPESTLLSNPLLFMTGLPRFNEIEPEHIVPAIKQLISKTLEGLEALEENLEPTWEGLIEPLDELGIPFEYAWGPVGHLLGVKNSDELRKAHEEVLPEMVQLGLRISQSPKIYEGLTALRNSENWGELDEGQKRVVEQKIRAAEHAGVGLEGGEKERFGEIARELSQLSTDFSNHVLDATKAFELIVTETAHTEGWPQNLRQVAAQSYAIKNETEPDPEKGPWRITLDYPSYVPFMQHSRQRDQREQVYRAFVTRASSGKLDNTPLIERILELRQEKAALLGFPNFAELSLDSKMAEDVNAVHNMTNELKAAAYDFALKEFEELQEFASKSGHEGPLQHWDLAFWAERLREARFDFTDEQLRLYFPLDRVIGGLFGLCEKLFEVSFERVENEVSIWHPDVRFYRVLNAEKQHISSFYLDPYSRPAEKKGGAWMNDCLGRRWIGGKLRTPVVHLCCNGTPPVGEIPSLMSFREVETLFHEFGHGLQGMLTTVDYTDVAGISGVEWDAVEIASQFMENWCYHKPTLIGMTAHFETDEPLPDELFEKLVAARTFQAGLQMMRQLLFGSTDLALHASYSPGNGRTAFDVYREFASKMSVLQPLPENRFLCGFSHIFAGGYAAGYYSYKWAEVLSADAFAAFEEVGLDNSDAVQRLGRRYRDTILAQGGSRHPMDVYKDFRGREPSTTALLKHSGLHRN